MRQAFAKMSSSLHRYRTVVAVSRFNVEFALAVLSGLAIVSLVGARFGDLPSVFFACGLFGLGAVVVARAMRRAYPHAEFGVCNLVTMSRLALTMSLVPLVLAAPPIAPTDLWAAFIIAVLAFFLDGVDGWAARRAGLVSRFGAGFDMEVDCVFALVLALIAWQTGQAGLWVLILGIPRYLFWVAGALWPSLTGDLPDTIRRKAVCVVQIGTLIAFLIPILPPPVMTVTAVTASVALAWSFFVDIRLLLSGGL